MPTSGRSLLSRLKTTEHAPTARASKPSSSEGTRGPRPPVYIGLPPSARVPFAPLPAATRVPGGAIKPVIDGRFAAQCFARMPHCAKGSRRRARLPAATAARFCFPCNRAVVGVDRPRRPDADLGGPAVAVCAIALILEPPRVKLALWRRSSTPTTRAPACGMPRIQSSGLRNALTIQFVAERKLAPAPSERWIAVASPTRSWGAAKPRGEKLFVRRGPWRFTRVTSGFRPGATRRPRPTARFRQ